METTAMPRGSALRTYLHRQFSNGAALSLIIAVIGAVGLCREGSNWRNLVFASGGTLSFVGLVAYMVHTEEVAEHRAKPGLVPMLVALFGGLTPCAVGCYFCAYEGAWGVFRGFSPFRFWAIIKGLFWLWAGYQIVLGIYRLSETCKAVASGRR